MQRQVPRWVSARVTSPPYMRYRPASSSMGMADMSGGGGGETRIKRQGEPVGGESLDDISTQLIRDKSNQVVGKLTVTEGAGAGNSVNIYTGTNQIGRGDDMRVQLNFGDDTISRQQHAVITYDAKNLEARIHDGGKPGGLWVNGTRVTADQQIKFGDMIKIGETTLKLDQA